MRNYLIIINNIKNFLLNKIFQNCYNFIIFIKVFYKSIYNTYENWNKSNKFKNFILN